MRLSSRAHAHALSTQTMSDKDTLSLSRQYSNSVVIVKNRLFLSFFSLNPLLFIRCKLPLNLEQLLGIRHKFARCYQTI